MKTISFYAGLFCVTAATLMLQLIQTRIISVIAWYHLAFFVIGAAMFGLTVGAVWVYLRGARYTQETLSFDLAHYSSAFAVSIAMALALQTTLVPVVWPSVTSLLVWIEFSVLLAVPFFFSGIVVTLALTRSPFPVGRVYGVDLTGAAIGCFGVLFLLDNVNGPSAMLWTSVIAALGALLFSLSDIGTEPAETPRLARFLKYRPLLLVILVAAASLNSLDHTRTGLYPVFAKGNLQLKELPWLERWNSYSRIIAEKPENDYSNLWGPSPTYDADSETLWQAWMNIDGDAATVALGIEGDLSEAQSLRYDVTNMAYHLPGRNSAAVIGVGGGRDLISARVFGVSEVIGIEINPIFVDLLTKNSPFSNFVGLKNIEGISLVVDEARSWFARSRDSFDVIQMSLIDTWAATGAGAFTLSENGLYTTEAWKIFLQHLTPRGVFTVSRWYGNEDAAETGRLVSLAVATLLQIDVKTPENHIFLAANKHLATLVVSRSGFSDDELNALKEATKRLKFDQLVAPGTKSPVDVLNKILSAQSVSQLLDYTQSTQLDLTPPTDNRPFFFNQLPLNDAAKVAALALSGRTPGVGYGNLFATATLVMLFVIALAGVIAAIVIPLRPALKDVGRRLVVGGSMYFILIGMGFMFTEIGFLQRFSVFLGHPIYSLSIVLFSLILSTGIGSLISDYVSTNNKLVFTLWAIATGGYLFALPFWTPSMLLDLESSSLLVRALIAIVIIIPVGLLMGFGFPTGMRFISVVDKRPTAWFWGINGASGVLASTIAVACSIAYGIGTTITLGSVCYLLLIPAAFIIGFPNTFREEGG